MRIKTEKSMEDFIEMEKLELKYYSEEHVTPHQEAFKWYLDFPETGVALEDRGKIIGFLDILPIKNSTFEGIRCGRVNDKYLTTDDMVKLDTLKSGESLNLLLSCVVVDETYRKTDALKILLKEHLDYYQTYINRGIIIEYIVTSNVTKQGERFSEKMGFERIGTSGHKTTLYISTFANFAERVKCI